MICVGVPNLNASQSNLNLRQIAENFDEHKDREITMNLRFKILDNRSQNIIFYDLRNRDIVFNYSNNRAIRRLIRANPLLHSGLIYEVKFIPREVDEFLNIKADLINYEPIFLERLPYEKAE